MNHPTNSGKRQQRPNCATCGHSLSFHGADLSKCKALGCNCAAYVGATQLGFDTITLPEAAKLLGLPDGAAVQALAAEHPELELEWVPESLLDTHWGSEMVWRVKRLTVEEYLTGLTSPRDS